MRNRVFVVVLLSLLLLSGFTFNNECNYLDIVCNHGNFVVYFPCDLNGWLYYDEQNRLIFNCSSNIKYGYSNINGDDYTIYFPIYDKPYYRVSNGGYGYTYYYLDDVSIVENNNVDFYKGNKVYVFDVMGIIVIVLLFWNLLRR